MRHYTYREYSLSKSESNFNCTPHLLLVVDTLSIPTVSPVPVLDTNRICVFDFPLSFPRHMASEASTQPSTARRPPQHSKRLSQLEPETKKSLLLAPSTTRGSASMVMLFARSPNLGVKRNLHSPGSPPIRPQTSAITAGSRFSRGTSAPSFQYQEQEKRVALMTALGKAKRRAKAKTKAVDIWYSFVGLEPGIG